MCRQQFDEQQMSISTYSCRGSLTNQCWLQAFFILTRCADYSCLLTLLADMLPYQLPFLAKPLTHLLAPHMAWMLKWQLLLHLLQYQKVAQVHYWDPQLYLGKASPGQQ